MSDNRRYKMEESSNSIAPVLPQQNYDSNVDYVISDYMERLGTRLNILETELKYAWRALDLLSQEYIKMWERLEKLEGLLYEQQSVIAQLLEFYTTGTNANFNESDSELAMLNNRMGELEVIREILGNGTIEDGLEEGIDVTRSANVHSKQKISDVEDMHIPDEAFYRSLNQAYREDLIGCETTIQPSQLCMIWEEREENEELNDKKNELKELENEAMLEENQDVFSAMDYKDYRGNSPCVNDQDLAQLSRISTIDQMAIEKLNELDRLSTKLQQDSLNIKELQRKLLESPHSKSNLDELSSKANILEEEKAMLEEKLRQAYNKNENKNWNFSTEIRNTDDLLLITKSNIPNSTSCQNRPSSRLSDSLGGTDNEVAETLAGGIHTPTSPRRRQLEITTCNAPYTTVTGRLAYSAAVHNAEVAEASQIKFNSKNPFYTDNEEFNSELSSLIAASYETVPCTSPNVFNVRSEKTASPTQSVCSVRTRQDGYVGTDQFPLKSSSPPPPPAPNDINEIFTVPMSTIVPGPQQGSVFLGAVETAPSSSITNHEHGRLSPKTPHSPKSPRTSPKRSKSHGSNIVTAKSDSGLSSMSGWSSLEKSPGSPKNGINKPQAISAFSELTINKHQIHRPHSPGILQNQKFDTRLYAESAVDSVLTGPLQVPVCNAILPGGHHLSAFTTVKSPCSLETTEGYGTFVPAPAPASDINVSPRRKLKHQSSTAESSAYGMFMSQNDQPAIYSVAGSNRQDSYASVYTSNSADYVNQTIRYPDLIEPYEHNEYSRPRSHVSYNASNSELPRESPSRKSRSHTNLSGPDNFYEGYKTAMQRTMFPTGNITDALSYYPTATRYESFNLPQAEYNEQLWAKFPADGQFSQENTSTSSSRRSIETVESSPYIDRRLQNKQEQQPQQQPIYQNQSMIDLSYNRNSWSHRQEIPYLELDLRNRNVPENIAQQQHLFDSSNMIVSQAGYLSISSNLNENVNQEIKPQKKIKRQNTLKSAMSSVSHWFPDIHITKRHRSYSLPSGVRREDIEETQKNAKISRKKKKNVLVSTMSGILQKAKRKGYQQHQTHSLSDPEQSENEWSTNRTSSVVSEDDRSEDNYSVFSDVQFDSPNLFEKVSNLQKNTTQPPQEKNDEEKEKPTNATEDSGKFQKNTTTEVNTPNNLNDDLNLLDNYLNEEIKNTSGNSSSLFATVGEVKKNSTSLERVDDIISNEKFPPVTIGTGSMEFAVSRALGKYRQRQTPTISDEQSTYEEVEEKQEDIIIEEEVFEENKVIEKPPLQPQKSVESYNEHNNKYTNNDDHSMSEGSPSTISLRGHIGKLNRHQQSLEIPVFRSEDDDNKSTHSWRSTSRVSSRRQSTEDSIDSEDEWYCYELKKLEEMERQSQLEAEFGETLEEVPEIEDSLEPCEDVKEKMSFVLQELRLKAKVVEGVLDEEDNRRQVMVSAKNREKEKRKSLSDHDPNTMFAKIKDYHSWKKKGQNSFNAEDYEEMFNKEFVQIQEDETKDDTVEEKEEKEENQASDGGEHSSGETSGPDSPHLSQDDYEEAEIASEDFPRCSKLSQDLTNETDENLQLRNETQIISSGVPTIQIDNSNCDASGPKEEIGKDSGPLGSKWKLLKALKERKAEERNNQERISDSGSDKDKVSMFEMMQKFYEIHVKN